MVSMDPETLIVDLAADASIRGIGVGQEWRISIGEEFQTGLDMLLDEAVNRRYATIEIRPHPDYADGVILVMVEDGS